MTEATSFLREINQAILQGSSETCARALWHATDLLMSGRYTDDQVWIFGEVIGRLADEIELAARATLARKLAQTDKAPTNLVKKLAFDDSITVAGPVLRHSRQLDTKTLIENARTKSQAHLLAIAKRVLIPELVTDELVTRGNGEVVRSVAANQGARISDFGFLHMIKRCDNDMLLAEHLGHRKEIPRHLFHQLIAKASDEVRRKLEQERPELIGQIQTCVSSVAGALHSKFGPASRDYYTAKKVVSRQHHRGDLNETSILEFARAHRIEEAMVGLSLLCSIPVEVVERASVDAGGDLTLILCKSLDFNWETAMAPLFLGAKDHRISVSQLDNMKSEYHRLGVEISRDVLNLYRSRRVSAAREDQGRLQQRYA